MKKGDRSIKEQIQRRLKPKGEAAKIGMSDFANQWVWLLICFEKIFPFLYKRATSCFP
jgi:hypothetical protein